MWDAVERESGGRIRTRLFPNSLLGSDPAMLTQLRLGSLQFLLATAGPLSGVVPSAGVSQLGFVFNDASQALRVMDGELGDYVRKEAAAKGLYAFRQMWNSGMQHLTSSVRTVAKADDLHGFKVRVSDAKVLIDLFHTLGANPTPLSVGESYTAMQTKLIDGATTVLSAIETLKWFEVQQHLSLTNHGFGAYWFWQTATFGSRCPTISSASSNGMLRPASFASGKTFARRTPHLRTSWRVRGSP